MVGFGFPCSGCSVSFRERWRRSKVMIGTTRTTSTPVAFAALPVPECRNEGRPSDAPRMPN